MQKNAGARFEISVDGTPRTYRDTQEIAMVGVTHLKTKQPHSEVTIRDIEVAR